MKLLILFSTVLGITVQGASYGLVTVTSSEGIHGFSNPGTKSNVYVRFEGCGKTAFVKLEIPGSGKVILQKSAVDTFLIDTPVDVKEVECIVFQTRGSDLWALDKATVSTSRGSVTFYNHAAKGISTDKKEGELELRMCAQGKRKYVLSTVTATSENADTNKIGLTMKIEGKDGTVAKTSLVDNKGINDFEKGRVDSFTFNSFPYMNVKCITLTANKGGEDKWIFNRIVLLGGKFPISFEKPGTTLSYNTKEGKQSVTFCV